MITLEYLKKNNHKIHYFGLGFIQIKIENQNYHFYTNRWNNVKDGIHTHKYNFNSEILAGTLMQNFYKEVDGNAYNKTLCDCQQGTEMEFVKSVGLESIFEGKLVAGSSYFLHRDTIHSVESDYCITRVSKGIVLNDTAIIYKPMDMRENVCPFMEVDELELWDEVDRMLKLNEQ
jgi:hypothetical protein